MQKVSRGSVSLTNKAVSVLLCIAVVFVCLVPVPTGNRLLDSRYGEAEAIAPAIPAMAVFAAAIAAGGLYVAGTTTADYNMNLNGLYADFEQGTPGFSDSWAQYCESHGSLQSALLSSVTDSGQIDLGVLARAGFFGALPAFASALIDSGAVVEGTNSLANTVNTGNRIVYNNMPLDFTTESQVIRLREGKLVKFAGYVSGPSTVYFGINDASYEYPLINYSQPFKTPGRLIIMGTDGWNMNVDRYGYMDGSTATTSNITNYDWENLTVPCLKYKTSSPNYGISISKLAEAGYALHLASGVSYEVFAAGELVATIYNGQVTLTDYAVSVGAVTGDYAVSGSVAAVEPSVVSGTASYPTSVVNVFEPTDAMLEQGFSKLDVTNAELAQQNRTLDGVLAGVAEIAASLSPLAGLLSPVLGIASAVATIAQYWAGLVAAPFDWFLQWWNTLSGWWQQVLDWLGATPIAQLIRALLEAIAGIQAGTIDISLDGVLSAIAELPSSIASVIVGAVTGIFVPEPDYAEEQIKLLVDDASDKFGADLVELEFSESPIEDIDAHLYLGLIDYDGVIFDASFLKDGVSFFRFVIRGFVVFLLALLVYNTMQRVIGGGAITRAVNVASGGD